MTVLITGASRGIGRQLADEYTARGETVIGTMRATALRGRGIEWQALDVTDPAAQAGLAEALEGRTISLLVCNAGVYLDKHARLETGYPAAQWAETFATNVTGVFLTVQALLGNLRAAPGAKIAIVSSIMASQARAPGGSYIYRASKAAVLNLGRNLAADLRAQGIAVGIYHPGWVRTDMGGEGADIGVKEAAARLVRRFDALSLATTGCFEAYDGTAMAY